MQPAYYENLEEIQKKLWSMLDDAVVNRNSPFRIPVFICADQNDIDGRIVVLRKSDQNNNLLQFHTDLRSQKENILKKKKNASYEFNDKDQKIKNKNSISEESWKKTQHISRRCYLTDSAPGSLSGSPTSGMISKLEDFDYTMEQSEKGYENFTVIKCEIKSIEWLYLAAKGHRRAIFNLSLIHI